MISRHGETVLVMEGCGKEEGKEGAKEKEEKNSTNTGRLVSLS